MIKLLDGIRVIECAMLPTGDQTSRLLGDLGADVIKVERPGYGDYLRELGDRITPQNSIFHMMCNRNKRSVTMDLRADEGRQLFFDLLKTADVFVDGFAGDACEKLGIGYEAQRAVKPDIIYCQASGFGRHGTYGQMPVHGFMMGAVGGQMVFDVDEDSVVREVQNPDGLYFSGSIDGPLSCALYAALTSVAALHRRQQTGEGAYIDASAADSVLANQCLDAVMVWNHDRITDRTNPPPPVGLDPRRRPKYTAYRTSDDKLVYLAAIEHKFWAAFCRAIDREDLLTAQNKAFAVDFADGGKADLLEVLIPIFESKTASEWVAIGLQHDIPLCPANSKADILIDPHMRARQIVHESVHPDAGAYTSPGWPTVIAGQTFDIAAHAPALGEQSEDVLTELGISPERISELKQRGIV